jgi:hypothetical protein
MVSAYCEEPVAYCLVADLESAERRGCRRACIVAFGAVTKAKLREQRRVANCVVGGAGFERARSCDTWAAFPRLQLGQHPRQANSGLPSAPDNTSLINTATLAR